jgi:hypothetical protein
MTTFFTFVGIAFTAIFAGIVLLLLSIWLYNVAKEAYVGIKVVLFLNDEWNEMVKRGMTQPKPTMTRIKETIKFYRRIFGNFQTTRFTSKLGNVFDWTV